MSFMTPVNERDIFSITVCLISLAYWKWHNKTQFMLSELEIFIKNIFSVSMNHNSVSPHQHACINYPSLFEALSRFKRLYINLRHTILTRRFLGHDWFRCVRVYQSGQEIMTSSLDNIIEQTRTDCSTNVHHKNYGACDIIHVVLNLYH